MKIVFFSIAFILVCGKNGLNAQQGNYKFNNFGNRSILLSGNVTGSVEDIALAYYNPARLTEVPDTRFAFNAKAYQLESLKISNILGEESAQNNNNFNGVPSMAGGTFNLFGTRFAYSFLSHRRSNIAVNFNSGLAMDDINNEIPGEEEFRIKLDVNWGIRDEWIGLTWAHKINDKLSLGISGFGSIYKYQAKYNLDYTIIAEEGNVAFYQYGSSFNQESYGLIMKVGANYRFSSFDLGLNIHVPYIEVYQNGRFNYNKTIAGINSESDQFIDYKFKDLSAKRKEPFGISVGAGIPIGMSKLHLNVDYISGIDSYQRMDIPDFDKGTGEESEVLFSESRRNVLNFGAGAELFITEKFKAYGSFSTDFNSLDNSTVLDYPDEGTKSANLGTNFLHGSVGIDWKLSWASIILGATYTTGSTEFISPLRPSGPEIGEFSEELPQADYTRWQFVVGLEFPFLENKLKGLMDEQN